MATLTSLVNDLAMQPWTTAFVLVLARMLGLVWPLTSWGIAAIDLRARLVMALLGATLLTPTMGPRATAALPADGGPMTLALACLAELASGLTLGLGAALVVAAARQGGELIGLAAGLSPQIDPGPPSGLVAAGGGPDEPLTPAGVLYTGFAIAAFLAIDGPLLLLRGLAESYRLIPAASVWPGLSPDSVADLTAGITGACVLALKLATPVVLPLLLAQAALLVLTRIGPTAPWASVTWPLRLALGLALIGLALAWTFSALRNSWLALIPGSGS